MGHYLAAINGRRGMTLCALLLLAGGWWMSAVTLLAITAGLVWGEELKRGAEDEMRLADWRRALAVRRAGRRTGA